MEIPGAATRPADAIYPVPALIPAVRREKRSVTEQISVCCFLSRLDRPALTSEPLILLATVECVVCITNAPRKMHTLYQWGAEHRLHAQAAEHWNRGRSVSAWTGTEKQRGITCNQTALFSATFLKTQS